MAGWIATAACALWWMLCGAAVALGIVAFALKRGGDDEEEEIK